MECIDCKKQTDGSIGAGSQRVPLCPACFKDGLPVQWVKLSGDGALDNNQEITIGWLEPAEPQEGVCMRCGNSWDGATVPMPAGGGQLQDVPVCGKCRRQQGYSV